MNMQTAQHLQECREHPRTKATAQNTHQMEETINLSNIYKMQMWIENDGDVPEHLFPCRLTELLFTTCLLTHFPPSWTPAGLWVCLASHYLPLLQLVGQPSCTLHTSFPVNTAVYSLPFCLYSFFCQTLPVCIRLFAYFLFSYLASTNIKGYYLIGC